MWGYWLRASYANEARATLEYFFLENVSDAKHIVSFDQNDAFGQAGYHGLVAAYTAVKGAFRSVGRCDDAHRTLSLYAKRHRERRR